METLLLDLSDNPYQREFVFSPHKYTAYYGGIRNGKSYGGCYRGLLLNHQFPGNVGMLLRKTYGEVWDTIGKIYLDWIRKLNGGSLNPGPYVRRFNQTMGELEIFNGSITYFRYADNPETILGHTLGWFYADQAEFIHEGIYDHLEGRLSLWSDTRKQECAEAYMRLHGEQLPFEPTEYGFITGNPAPGWVHRRYKQGIKTDGTPIEGNPYVLIEAPTDANMKNLPQGYMDDLKRTHTQAWIDRWLGGSWETFTGQIYSEYQPALHNVPLMPIPAHWPRFLGWDHGTENATAVVFVAVDENGNCVVYNEHYKVSAIIKEHAEAVLALCVGDAVPRTPDGKGVVVWIDPAVSGDHAPDGRDFKELYEELGIFGLNANKQVNAGIQKVSLLLHPDSEHKFPDWHPRKGEKGAPRLYFMDGRAKATLHELLLYEWEPVPEGAKVNAKEKPVKYLDHAMDALRYAIMAVFEKARPLEKTKTVTYDDEVLAEILGINAELKANYAGPDPWNE